MILVGLALVLLVLLGAPLFAVIGASVLLGFANADVDLTVVIIEIYRLARSGSSRRDRTCADRCRASLCHASAR